LITPGTATVVVVIPNGLITAPTVTNRRLHVPVVLILFILVSLRFILIVHDSEARETHSRTRYL
jgi:hypothetical protein